jgi:IclR family pca regulon transcriptional regulator
VRRSATPRTATKVKGVDADAAAEPAPRPEFVQGVERCFTVIRAFGHDTPALTIAGVSERTGLTRAVARRYLLTLRDLGYLVQRGTLFSMTPRILEIGFTYLMSVDIARVAQPYLETLVETLHESSSAAVLDSADIVYVVRVPARRIMSANLTLGSRLPAHATSMGKVLLAYAPPQRLEAYLALDPLQALTRHTITDEQVFRRTLEETRRRGWAAASDESELGVRSIAAPVFNHRHEVEAAVNLAGHASRLSMKRLKEVCLPALLETTGQLSRALGASLRAVEPARVTERAAAFAPGRSGSLGARVRVVQRPA